MKVKRITAQGTIRTGWLLYAADASVREAAVWSSGHRYCHSTNI